MINWRWYLFWFKDCISGGQIHKAYKEFISNELKEIDTTQKLNNLLRFAKNNTNFYTNVKECKIHEFPVINKNIINENYDDFISKPYKDKKLHKMSTSGSTGTPFTILQNVEKRKRVIAELLYYNMKCGYKFGERQVYFRVWTDKNRKSSFKSFLQNLIPQDISNLSEENIEIILEKLKKDKHISNILSYASTLEKLSSFAYENNYKPEDFSLKSIISSSEILKDETRQKLKDCFDCNIVSRYSNQENGVIAQECTKFKEMHINDVNYYIEFLKMDSDETAEEGEISRVVITDLYNYAMPMIRYDTGDLAVFSSTPKCEERGRVITEIYGRKVDSIFDTKGNMLSPHIITNNMWGIKNVKQFKFQQIGMTEYKIILNKIANTNINEEEIINKFRKLLGENSKITIEYVEEIPILSSGKTKYIENLYTQFKDNSKIKL